MKEFFILILFLMSTFSYCQEIDHSNDASIFLRVNSIEEFIERFNYENISTLSEYVETNSIDSFSRDKALFTLFNWEDSTKHDLYNEFLSFVLSSSDSLLFEYYSKDWFIECDCEFMYNSKSVDIIMVFENWVKKDYSEWRISDVRTDSFNMNFIADSSKFLSPMSHENDFVELDEILSDIKYLGNYLKDDFEISQLSLFLYELKRGRLKFKNLNKKTYFINQFRPWSLKVEYFNRNTNNSGWLISDIHN